MEKTQSTSHFSQVPQLSEDSPTSSSSSSSSSSSESLTFQPFPSWNTFPGITSQPRTASLTTTTLPVWVYTPPITQTLLGDNNQKFISTNPSIFPPVSTASTSTVSSTASVIFSAPQVVNSSGQSALSKARFIRQPSRKKQFPQTMPTKETSQNGFFLTSTTASSVFLSSSGLSSMTAPKESVTTSASNVVTGMKTLTLPDTKGFKFNSCTLTPTEGKNNTFKWSVPASSQSANENTFGVRGSLFNSSGHSSPHPSNSLPAKFVPPIEEDVCEIVYGRFQSITAMAEYSSKSFEEIRLEYYQKQQKIFLFGSSSFSFNSPCFFRSRNKESKQLVHKEVQTSGDADPYSLYAKGLLNEIWKILECIICLETVKTPIMQCESGHHFCSQCWSKVTVCPMCKRNKTNVRNYALESLFEKVPMPCKYHNEGCKRVLIVKDKHIHESACSYRICGQLSGAWRKFHKEFD